MRLYFYALCLTSLLCSAGAAERPNILFVFSDDHATAAISAYGSKINQTPHLDRLAKEGMRFDACFATNSICTPSRATVLTGKYSHTNGTPVFNRFDGAQLTVAKELQKAGYYTAVVGKWHLGSDPTGFDEWEILPGQGSYHDPVLYTAKGQKRYAGEYVSDVITARTRDFIKKRPADKPFFVFCGHKAPHRTWEPHARYAKWKTQEIPEPATLRDTFAGRSKALAENAQTITRDLTPKDLKEPIPADLSGDALLKWKYQRYLQDYLACVQSVDDSVGELLAFLEAEKLAENTVVIYSSDQGFFLGEHGLYDKRFMYEPSIRMPFLVRWPQQIKPGSTSDALAINPDFAPTFLDLAGAAVPAEMQGRSLAPLMRGETPSDWRTSFYYRYYHDPGDHRTARHLGVRTTTHKLIWFDKLNEWEMYDLKSDPDEMHNLYAEAAHADQVTSLKKELFRLKESLGDRDQFIDAWPPGKVDGQVEKLRTVPLPNANAK
jgi:arylsulfatase A-like enzyme